MVILLDKILIVAKRNNLKPSVNKKSRIGKEEDLFCLSFSLSFFPSLLIN